MNLKILTIDGFTSELNLSNLPNNLEELDICRVIISHYHDNVTDEEFDLQLNMLF